MCTAGCRWSEHHPYGAMALGMAVAMVGILQIGPLNGLILFFGISERIFSLAAYAGGAIFLVGIVFTVWKGRWNPPSK